MSEKADSFLRKFRVLFEVTDARVFGRDASNPYCDLLYHVANELKSVLIVELGTCTGGSTSHFAAGTSGKVISIDIESRSDTVERLSIFDNIELIVGNTLDPALAWQISKRGPIDILFIDTDHNAEQVIIELSLYGPLVRLGGIILFDDIRINDGMSQWWDNLNKDKLELPEMHHTGFGVVFR